MWKLVLRMYTMEPKIFDGQKWHPTQLLLHYRNIWWINFRSCSRDPHRLYAFINTRQKICGEKNSLMRKWGKSCLQAKVFGCMVSHLVLHVQTWYKHAKLQMTPSQRSARCTLTLDLWGRPLPLSEWLCVVGKILLVLEVSQPPWMTQGLAPDQQTPCLEHSEAVGNKVYM